MNLARKKWRLETLLSLEQLKAEPEVAFVKTLRMFQQRRDFKKALWKDHINGIGLLKIRNSHNFTKSLTETLKLLLSSHFPESALLHDKRDYPVLQGVGMEGIGTPTRIEQSQGKYVRNIE